MKESLLRGPMEAFPKSLVSDAARDVVSRFFPRSHAILRVADIGSLAHP